MPMIGMSGMPQVRVGVAEHPGSHLYEDESHTPLWPLSEMTSSSKHGVVSGGTLIFSSIVTNGGWQ